MKKYLLNSYKWIFVFLCVISVGFLWKTFGFTFGRERMHNFTGICHLCHVEIPKEGASFEDAQLISNVDKVCLNCHDIDGKMSHPVGVRVNREVPLQRYLNSSNQLTCLTCHDVHKEKKESYQQSEIKGLLRGHVRGRAFCFTCHDEKTFDGNKQHNMSVTYAHMSDKLIESQKHGLLDKFSIECLSCHDGVISKRSGFRVRGGEFQHNLGLNHPVGIEYPNVSRKGDFVPKSALPSNVKLFDGKIGCLSCHNPYEGKESLLVKENKRSVLCLTCHKK